MFKRIRKVFNHQSQITNRKLSCQRQAVYGRVLNRLGAVRPGESCSIQPGGPVVEIMSAERLSRLSGHDVHGGTIQVGEVHGDVFGAIRPASTLVQVAALAHPDWLIEVEAIAVV